MEEEKRKKEKEGKYMVEESPSGREKENREKWKERRKTKKEISWKKKSVRG